MSRDPEDPGGSRPHTVIVEDEQTSPVDTDAARVVAERALATLGVPTSELSITFVDAEAIAALKEDAFGERAVTDVLSFPMDDPHAEVVGPRLLGDIVICPTVAERQARALGIEPADEIAHLIVHGILHVIGRDHATARDELAMAADERDVLSAIGEVL